MGQTGLKDPLGLRDGDERHTKLSPSSQLRNRIVTARVGPLGRDMLESPHRKGTQRWSRARKPRAVMGDTVVGVK